MNKKKIVFCIIFAASVSILGFALVRIGIPSEPPLIKTVHISTSTATDSETSLTRSSVVLPLNLNTAGEEELVCLDGVGEVLAKRIVEYRRANGSFTNRYELLKVEGIGEAKLNAIYESVYIDGEAPYTSITNICEITVGTPKTLHTTIVTSHTTYISLSEGSASDFSVVETSTASMLDINTASAEEFAGLDGINEALANEIVALRERIHSFSSPYELLYAKGMNERILAGILGNIYVKETNVNTYIN